MTSTTDSSFNQDSLLQTIRYGPMDYDMFLEHRVNAFPEKTEELKFLLNEFRQLNYHFNKIVEFERYYLSDRDSVAIERDFMIINYTPERLKKREGIAKFGKAALSNEGCTTRSDTRVYLTPPGVDSEKYAREMDKHFKVLEEKYKFWECNKYGKSLAELSSDNSIKTETKFEDKRDLADVNDRIDSKNSSSKFKLFKISSNAMTYMKKAAENESEKDNESDNKGGFKVGGYLPPGMRRKTIRPKNPDTLYSVVVKNVPQYIDPRDAEKQLRQMFNEYGDIHKIKVLRTYDDKVNKNKGIAFIDFYDEESKNNAIADRGTKTIDHMIIGVEEKKAFK